MRGSLLLTITAMLCSAPAFAQAGAQDAGLLPLLDGKNKQIDDAFISGKPAVFLDLVSPAAMITNPTGALVGRGEIADIIGNGTLKYTAVKVSEQKVAQFGKVAVFTFLTDEKGSMQGQDISGKYRYTQVWNNEDGQWKLVAVQITPVLAQ